MFLKRIDIRNFRGIAELSLELDDLCVLIGENNAGKSSVLDALRLCMTRFLARRDSVFEEYDYHLDDASAEPSREKPIEITLRFAEREGEEWPDEVSQLLGPAEQVDNEETRSVTLRVRSTFNPAGRGHNVEYDFLDLSGNAIPQAKNPRLIINLQQLAPTFYLGSFRDAEREFRTRSSFWGPFVRSLDIDEEAQAELEKALLDLNNKILDRHSAFDAVKERLSNTAELLMLGQVDPVSIEAVPSRLSDILSRAQVNLESKTGARIPVAHHGSGTQSLAVICLFNAYLESQLKEQYGEHAEALLSLEEPEAHLHPSAVKTAGEMLRDLSGQKLLSTHSGDLLAGIPLKKIRRLSRKDGKVVVHSIAEDALTRSEISKLDYHVRTKRGSLLFSRCWLLVEGETDVLLISECARVMGRDLYAGGVSCIEFAHVGVEKFIKLADQLGIEWFVLADNDSAGRKFKRTALRQIKSREEREHVQLLDHGNMEVFLCKEGFGDVYEKGVSGRKRKTVTAKKNSSAYWKQVSKAQSAGKPERVLDVVERIREHGRETVPDLIKRVIEQAIGLAGRGA